MRLRGCLILATLSLAGCAGMDGPTSEQIAQSTRMESALSRYVGKSIADIAIARGPAQSDFEIAKGTKVFQWVSYGQAPGMSAVMNNMMITRPGAQLVCRVSFTAKTDKPQPTLADWQIVSWRWEGHC